MQRFYTFDIHVLFASLKWPLLLYFYICTYITLPWIWITPGPIQSRRSLFWSSLTLTMDLQPGLSRKMHSKFKFDAVRRSQCEGRFKWENRLNLLPILCQTTFLYLMHSFVWENNTDYWEGYCSSECTTLELDQANSTAGSICISRENSVPLTFLIHIICTGLTQSKAMLILPPLKV